MMISNQVPNSMLSSSLTSSWARADRPLARGALDGWYPYPFIEVPKLGYGQVLLNAAGISAVLALGGLALIALAKRITSRA